MCHYKRIDFVFILLIKYLKNIFLTFFYFMANKNCFIVPAKISVTLSVLFSSLLYIRERVKFIYCKTSGKSG